MPRFALLCLESQGGVMSATHSYTPCLASLCIHLLPIFLRTMFSRFGTVSQPSGSLTQFFQHWHLTPSVCRTPCSGLLSFRSAESWMLHTHPPIWLQLCSPTWLKMLLPTPNDSGLLSRAVDLSHLTRRDDPFLSCLHPRACLPEVCVLNPVSPLLVLD